MGRGSCREAGDHRDAGNPGGLRRVRDAGRGAFDPPRGAGARGDGLRAPRIRRGESADAPRCSRRPSPDDPSQVLRHGRPRRSLRPSRVRRRLRRGPRLQRGERARRAPSAPPGGIDACRPERGWPRAEPAEMERRRPARLRPLGAPLVRPSRRHRHGRARHRGVLPRAVRRGDDLHPVRGRSPPPRGDRDARAARPRSRVLPPLRLPVRAREQPGRRRPGFFASSPGI